MFIAAAIMRAFTGGNLQALGNFYVDLTRITLYLLLPVSLVAWVLLLAAGMPMTFAPFASVHTLTGGTRTIACGPVAFMEAIKEFGTNGGGFFNANSAHPFKNPTIFTNILENWLLLVTGFALPVAFGHMIGRRREGLALYAAVAIVLGCGMFGAYTAGNPLLAQAGVSAHHSGSMAGNMVGKEARFGIAASSAFNVSATGTSTGAVDAMTDSFTPLGGLVPLFLMQLGEVSPG